MTRSLRRAISLLSFSKNELIQFLDDALRRNPYLVNSPVLPFSNGVPVECDLMVFSQGGHCQVALNWEGLPRLSIGNPSGMTPQDGESLHHDARSLVEAVARRGEILYAVAEHAVACQGLFLKGQRATPVPLKFREIAQRLKLHESTVSRAVNGKIIYRQGQMLELSAFFAKGRRQLIRGAIEELIGCENLEDPLGDETLARLLQEKGLEVSRRTVTKHRHALRIPQSRGRLKCFHDDGNRPE